MTRKRKPKPDLRPDSPFIPRGEFQARMDGMDFKLKVLGALVGLDVLSSVIGLSGSPKASQAVAWLGQLI